MTQKEKRRTAADFLCALIWGGVGFLWFLRACRGSVGTPWFSAALGLACLSTAAVYVWRGARRILNTKRNVK